MCIKLVNYYDYTEVHGQQNIKKWYDNVDCHIPVERVFVRHLRITSLRPVISHFTRRYACLRFKNILAF